MAKQPGSHTRPFDKEGRLYARVPKKLKKALIASAQRAGRPLNAELMIRLAHSLEHVEFMEGVPEWMNE